MRIIVTIGMVLALKRKETKRRISHLNLHSYKEKKSEKRFIFFDAKGDGGSSDEYSSVNMIYFSEAVIEEQEEEEEEINEETAFVIITAKMQAAFSAVSDLLRLWVFIDTA